MNVYRQKFYWKIGLLIIAVLIVLISLVYNNNLAKKLANEEIKKAEMYGAAQNELQRLNSTYDVEEEFDSILQVLKSDDPQLYLKLSYIKSKLEPNLSYFPKFFDSNTTIPVIIVGDNDEIVAEANLGYDDDDNDDNEAINTPETEEEKALEEKYKQETLAYMRANFDSIRIEIVPGVNQYLFYSESNLLKRLRWYPFIQLGLIGAFLLIAYLAFSSARRAEQDHVWVGMARETAHQLGTPLSSLSAWIEMLKINEDSYVQEIGTEMDRDTNRLNLIAERFSKIGSKPKLEENDLKEHLNQTLNYVKRRASKKIKFTTNFDDITDAKLHFSPPLLDWVIENLLKNALDAMDGKGFIKMRLEEAERHYIIDVSDSGKGIKSNFNDVFKPGFSTKKRGWGLGLSLSKRIIEEYHKGRIYVHQSAPNKGTTFRIVLPKKGGFV